MLNRLGLFVDRDRPDVAGDAKACYVRRYLGRLICLAKEGRKMNSTEDERIVIPRRLTLVDRLLNRRRYWSISKDAPADEIRAAFRSAEPAWRRVLLYILGR